MRRRLLSMAVLAVASPIIFAFMLWIWPSRINIDNCIRFQEGMSRAEVETILGPPSKDWSQFRKRPFGPSIFEWIGDDAKIIIYFDNSGLVSQKSFSRDSNEQQSPLLDNFVRQVQMLWQRWFP